MATPHITLLVPVCSRNQAYAALEDIPFLKRLYASFLQTAEFDKYTYTFYIGFDDDDDFYKTHRHALQAINPQFQLIELSGCQHAPAFAWNKLAAAAMQQSATPYTYFFQVGDDVVLLRPGWTTAFVERLVAHGNKGVVGPCNRVNYYQRVNHGRPYVIENAFVHRTHLQVFDTFFPATIRNWYCDDWMTRVYDDIYHEILLDYPCENSIVDARYTIAHPENFEVLVANGKARLQTVNS
jgi:hypothetical protein